ncbi:phosphate-starvation-inducible protein PsiE [Thiolinea disciformis]|uniref:phosphate-starvation-inducible protein PsiE n=1 Tax=Thiolinea disciformis TaxID=125614 RepID=UPI0003661336|nr:phosphate-starvation-inducible PsiE family protein [Thiolinea disciformis]
MANHPPLAPARHMLHWLEYFLLIIVTLATLIAIGQEIVVLITQMKVTISDLLLLFIYLEVIGMVAAYLESGKVPVRMPLYIAMVALARYLILDMKSLDNQDMVAIAGAILIISLAVLVVRFGHVRYPYDGVHKDSLPDSSKTKSAQG